MDEYRFEINFKPVLNDLIVPNIKGVDYSKDMSKETNKVMEKTIDAVNKKIAEIMLQSKKRDNSFGSYFQDEDGKEFYLKEVIYNDPAVICFWSDGVKTVAKCSEEDCFSPETGLTIAVLKRLIGNKFFSRLIQNWAPEEYDGHVTKITLKDVLKAHS